MKIFGSFTAPTHVLHCVGDQGNYISVDVSDPAQPRVMTEIADNATYGDLQDVVVDAANKDAYLIADTPKLFSMDISIAAAVTKQGELGSPGASDASCIELDGSDVYIGSAQNSGASHAYVASVDVSTPTSPATNDSISSSSYGGIDTSAIDGSRNALFLLARESDDLVIVNITSPGTLSTHAVLALTSATAWGFHGMDYDSDGQYLFLADATNNEIVPVNVGTLASPSEGTGVSLNTITNAGPLVVDTTNNYAYLSSGNGAQGWEAFSISTPSTPSFVRYLAYPDTGFARGMCVDARGYLWSVRSNSKLTAVDISDPATSLSVESNITIPTANWYAVALEVVS